MVVCQKCGYDNELGRIFCHSCGAKLNLSEIKSPSQGGKSLTKKAAGTPTGRIVRRTINAVILVAVIVTFYLAAQIPPIRPISTANDDFGSADKKRMQLDDLVTQKQPQTITVSEAELNSLIGSQGFEKGNRAFLEVVPTQLQLELGEGVVTAIFLGKIHLGGSLDKQIYLSYTGVPTVEGGHFVFKPLAGAVGTLPISGWILEKTGVLDRYYAKVFTNLGHEKDVLGSLSSISVTAKEAVLNYQPH